VCLACMMLFAQDAPCEADVSDLFCRYVRLLLTGMVRISTHGMAPVQVHDLMMYLEGQRQLADAGPDVQQGSISVPTPPAPPTPQPGSHSKQRAAKVR
jgi:hypothetical protein